MSATARVVNNAVVYVSEYDMSGDENEVQLAVTVDQKEATIMADTTRQYKPGLANFDLSLLGYTSYGVLQLDDSNWSKLATESLNMTLCPEGVAAMGNRAWLLRTANMGYEQRLTVGEMPSFRLSYKGNASPMVQGVILKLPVSIVSFPDTSTGYQVGAVTSDQYAYATLHILSLTGAGTLTVKVKSCATLGGTYVDRITFTGATVIGSQWGSVVGPITDTYWQVLTAQSGSITAATIAVGIGIM